MPPNAQCAANVQRRRKEAEMNAQQCTILYERLSRDDGEDNVSNSIKNQQSLLQDYAERNGLTPYIHVFDDGYSGTGWNRPGWQKVIAEIKAGNVHTIVVKNLDRMGRDYLRVGLYMEMFREKGIRLIAVSDGIDTSRGDDDFTPFRAIFAEWFARDTSKKIKAVISAKGRSGKPLASIPPYGYIKDPNDKYHWIVDAGAAKVVKRIFEMTIEGNGPHEIARKLVADQVECPSYYMGSRGFGNYKNKYDKDNPYKWQGSMVISILKRLEYVGNTVNFRTQNEHFKTKKRIYLPQKDWLVIENTHEAIISQKDFDTVQKLRGTPRRIDKIGEANPLTGLLFCSDCGAKLYNSRDSKPKTGKYNGKPYNYKPADHYECSTHILGKKTYTAACSSHYIRSEAVREIILDTLRRTSGYVREHEAEFIEVIRERFAIKQGETAKSTKKQIAKNERRIAELEHIFRSLYEDKALGRIDMKRFEEISGGYEQEREELLAKTAELQTELDVFYTDSTRLEKFIELLRQYTHFDELTPKILNEFVDKVVVHEGEWSEGKPQGARRGMGTRSQAVEVYLKYIGSFDVPDLRTVDEIEAERVAFEKLERKREYNREYARRRVAAQKTASQIA